MKSKHFTFSPLMSNQTNGIALNHNANTKFLSTKCHVSNSFFTQGREHRAECLFSSSSFCYQKQEDFFFFHRSIIFFLTSEDHFTTSKLCKLIPNDHTFMNVLKEGECFQVYIFHQHQIYTKCAKIQKKMSFARSSTRLVAWPRHTKKVIFEWEGEIGQFLTLCYHLIKDLYSLKRCINRPPHRGLAP